MLRFLKAVLAAQIAVAPAAAVDMEQCLPVFEADEILDEAEVAARDKARAAAGAAYEKGIIYKNAKAATPDDLTTISNRDISSGVAGRAGNL